MGTRTDTAGYRKQLIENRGTGRRDAGIGNASEPRDWRRGRHGPIDEHEKRLGRAAVGMAVEEWRRTNGNAGDHCHPDAVLAALRSSSYFAQLDDDNSLERRRAVCGWLIHERVLVPSRFPLMLADLTPVRARISLDTNGHILRGENYGPKRVSLACSATNPVA